MHTFECVLVSMLQTYLPPFYNSGFVRLRPQSSLCFPLLHSCLPSVLTLKLCKSQDSMEAERLWFLSFYFILKTGHFYFNNLYCCCVISCKFLLLFGIYTYTCVYLRHFFKVLSMFSLPLFLIFYLSLFHTYTFRLHCMIKTYSLMFLIAIVMLDHIFKKRNNYAITKNTA